MFYTYFFFYEYLTAPAPQRPPPKKKATNVFTANVVPRILSLASKRTLVAASLRGRRLKGKGKGVRLGCGWSRDFQNLGGKNKGGEEE